jgi:hypothetical protein
MYAITWDAFLGMNSLHFDKNQSGKQTESLSPLLAQTKVRIITASANAHA